jgi:AraC family transcriptional regulator
MTLTPLERPALTVVGMAIRTRPQSPEIPALWPRFVARIDEIRHRAAARESFGVMRYESGALCYMAGIAVTADGDLPPGMESLTLPSGTYATFRYPLSDLGKGFGEIYNRLLPASEFLQLPGRPLFERYDEAFDPDNPASMVEIGIPVRRKS